MKSIENKTRAYLCYFDHRLEATMINSLTNRLLVDSKLAILSELNNTIYRQLYNQIEDKLYEQISYTIIG